LYSILTLDTAVNNCYIVYNIDHRCLLKFLFIAQRTIVIGQIFCKFAQLLKISFNRLSNVLKIIRHGV
jgi:hypothetical protein